MSVLAASSDISPFITGLILICRSLRGHEVLDGGRASSKVVDELEDVRLRRSRRLRIPSGSGGASFCVALYHGMDVRLLDAFSEAEEQALPEIEDGLEDRQGVSGEERRMHSATLPAVHEVHGPIPVVEAVPALDGQPVPRADCDWMP